MYYINSCYKKRYNYTYKVITPPSEEPITLAQVKEQLKIDNNDSDDLLILYIKAATSYAEKFTRKLFISRTIKTFRDYFPPYSYYGCQNTGFEIRRSPFVSVTSIEYKDINNNNVVVAPSIYYNTLQQDFSWILLKSGNSWPCDVICQLQAIKITFVAGYDSQADVPQDIQNALLQMVASLYENRGDCSDASCSSACATFLPSAAKSILLQNRIKYI